MSWLAADRVASTAVLVNINPHDPAEQSTVETLRVELSVAAVAFIPRRDIQKPVITEKHSATDVPLLAVVLIDQNLLCIERNLSVDNREARYPVVSVNSGVS